jgi:endonuclease/exonuclease/phosphatase (EEP) superfamily protein YafD
MDLRGFMRALQNPSAHYRVPREQEVLRRPEGRARAELKQLPRELDLLIWNLQKGASQATLEDLRSRPELRDADLHLFQEFKSGPEWNALLNGELARDWWIAPHFLDHEGQATGVVTGSRSVSGRATAIPSQGREPISNTPKMILYSSYPVEGGARDLGVINVHAINFVSFQYFEAQLRDLARAVSAHEGPLVVAGDFNTWSARRLDRLRETLAEGELRVVDLDPRELKPGLDHLFVRGVDVREARVLTEFTSSDHFPIRASLTVTD